MLSYPDVIEVGEAVPSLGRALDVQWPRVSARDWRDGRRVTVAECNAQQAGQGEFAPPSVRGQRLAEAARGHVSSDRHDPG